MFSSMRAKSGHTRRRLRRVLQRLGDADRGRQPHDFRAGGDSGRSGVLQDPDRSPGVGLIDSARVALCSRQVGPPPSPFELAGPCVPGHDGAIPSLPHRIRRSSWERPSHRAQTTSDSATNRARNSGAYLDPLLPEPSVPATTAALLATSTMTQRGPTETRIRKAVFAASEGTPAGPHDGRD
jgi:hypothetical protein